MTRRAHPRVCGEKESSTTGARCHWGSPPHARGKERLLQGQGRYPGITPACAGKSYSIGSALAASRDHPRMRGEKTQKALKYERSFFQVLIFPLTSDRSQVSAHSLSVLDGNQPHPVQNKRILPQGNNCSARQVSVGPALGYPCTGFLVSEAPLFYSQPEGNRNRMHHDAAPTGQSR